MRRASSAFVLATALSALGAPAHAQQEVAPAATATHAPAPATPPATPPAEPYTTPWILLAGAGASLGVGIGFGVASVIEHRRSRDLAGGFGDDAPDEENRDAYQEAIDARDDFRVVSGIAGGAALGLFVLGGVLFALDDAETPPKGPSATRAFVVPWAGPGLVGAGAEVRF